MDTNVLAEYDGDILFGLSQTVQGYNFADTFMPGYASWLCAYQPCTLKRLI